MHFSIDPKLSTSLYVQIMEQIQHAIYMGIFQPGEALPTIRELALQIKVNPNTVAKAFRELEREGILITRVGKGSFVSETAPIQLQSTQMAKADELAFGYGKDMRYLGFQQEESVEKVRENWEDNTDE